MSYSSQLHQQLWQKNLPKGHIHNHNYILHKGRSHKDKWMPIRYQSHLFSLTKDNLFDLNQLNIFYLCLTHMGYILLGGKPAMKLHRQDKQRKIASQSFQMNKIYIIYIQMVYNYFMRQGLHKQMSQAQNKFNFSYILSSLYFIIFTYWQLCITFLTPVLLYYIFWSFVQQTQYMKLVEYKILFFLFFFTFLSTFVFSQSIPIPCEFGSFLNSLGQCMECLSSCPKCNSLTTQICKQCTQGLKLKKNLCVPCNIGEKNCDEGNFQCIKFYTKEEGICKPECNVKNCKNCPSATSTVCEKCLSGFNLSGDKKQCFSNKRILQERQQKLMENSSAVINELQNKNSSQPLANNSSNVSDQKTIIVHQNNNSHTEMESGSNLTRNQSMNLVIQNSTVIIPTNIKINEDNSSSIPHTNSTSSITNQTVTLQNSTVDSFNHSTNQTKSNTSISKNSTSQPNIFNTNSSTSTSRIILPMTITQQNNSLVQQNRTIRNPQINQTSRAVQANIATGENQQKIGNSTTILTDCGKNGFQRGGKCQTCNPKCGLCTNTPNQCLQCSEGYRKLGWKCMRAESIKFIIELEKKKNLSSINEDIYNVTKEIASHSLPTQYEKNMSQVTLQELKLTPMLINITGYIDCKLKNCSLLDLQNHINTYFEQKKSLNNMKINSFKLLQNVNGNNSKLLSKIYSTQTSKYIQQPAQPSQQTKVNKVAIILPIVLGLVFLLLIIGCVCYYYKKCCFKPKQNGQTSYADNQNEDVGRVDTQRHINRNKKTPTEIELDAIPDYVTNKDRNTAGRFADEKIQEFGNMESDI